MVSKIKAQALVAFNFVLVMAFATLGHAFDGERALALIRDQVELGPRVPGTPAHAAGRQWIIDQFEALGYHVVSQDFATTLPQSGAGVTASNIWALPTEDGPATPALLISAHWDTRPWADQPASIASQRLPLDGANDGGSGVAMALELARGWQQSDLRPHIAFAMWDVEDAGTYGDNDSWALGSRYAVANPPEWIDRLALGINLDMVAGHDLRLKREAYSMDSAPWAVEEVWRLGAMLNPVFFEPNQTIRIIDDHLPWIESGRPYINIIGWPYEQWHTVNDSIEYCRPEVLQAVGEVVQFYVEQRDWMQHSPLTRTGASWGLNR